MEENNTSTIQKQEDDKTANERARTDKPKKSKKMLLYALAGLLLVAVLAGAGLGVSDWNKQRKAAAAANKRVTELESNLKTSADAADQAKKELNEIKESTGESNIDKTAFQAVFFKSGNVYFGKITKMTLNQITLENIYYIRSGGGGSNIDNGATDVSLVKLGNELHGPQDVMYIERKEVDFWENLKADGQVAKAIAEYEKNQ